MPSPWGRTTPSTWLVGQAGLGTAIPVTGESCSPERTNHEPKGLNSVKAKPEQKTWMSAKAVGVERCKLATQTEPEKANFYLSMSCSFTTLNRSRHQTYSCQHPQRHYRPRRLRPGSRTGLTPTVLAPVASVSLFTESRSDDRPLAVLSKE